MILTGPRVSSSMLFYVHRDLTVVRACICYLMLILTSFSYNCNLFKHFFFFFFSSFFPELFCSLTFYVAGMFQSKFPFKNNKVVSYLIRDGEPRTSTLTCTQLLNSEL